MSGYFRHGPAKRDDKLFLVSTQVLRETQQNTPIYVTNRTRLFNITADVFKRQKS